MPKPMPSFASGVSELLVLRLLDQREMYGYELARTILAATRETIALQEGVLYPLLHALETQGLLRSRKQTVAGRPRIYYSVSAKGRKRLASLSAEWKRVSSGVASAMEGLVHA